MALDMFFKIGNILGEAQDKAYNGSKGYIDVLAWSWAVSSNGSAHTGSGSGTAKASFQDINITKYVDASTPDLIKSLAKGDHHPTAELIIRKSGGDKPLDYLVFELEEVIITSVALGGSGGEERFSENVTINFRAFKTTYTEQLKDGHKGKTPYVSFDIAANIPR